MPFRLHSILLFFREQRIDKREQIRNFEKNKIIFICPQCCIKSKSPPLFTVSIHYKSPVAHVREFIRREPGGMKTLVLQQF